MIAEQVRVEATYWPGGRVPADGHLALSGGDDPAAGARVLGLPAGVPATLPTVAPARPRARRKWSPRTCRRGSCRCGRPTAMLRRIGPPPGMGGGIDDLLAGAVRQTADRAWAVATEDRTEDPLLAELRSRGSATTRELINSRVADAQLATRAGTGIRRIARLLRKNGGRELGILISDAEVALILPRRNDPRRKAYVEE